MSAKTQRIEVLLETLLESVDLAERISMRVAEAAGFPEEEVHKIGMAVREGVINAYNYGNQQDRHKKIMMTVELQPDNAEWWMQRASYHLQAGDNGNDDVGKRKHDIGEHKAGHRGDQANLRVDKEDADRRNDDRHHQRQ